MVTLFPTEVLLPCGLDAGFSGVVAAAVLTGMAVQEALVHFGNISEEVSAGVEGIITDGSGHAFEAGELVFHLVEPHVCLRRNLPQHDYGLISNAAPVLPVFFHLFPDEVLPGSENAGEGGRVEGLDLPGGHEDVIGDLVPDENPPCAVIDDAPCRVNHLIYHGVVGGVPLVPVVENLDLEEAGDQNCDRYPQTYEKPCASG